MNPAAVEHCAECGFDGAAWTDTAALDAIGTLGSRWRAATAGLDAEHATRRPLAGTWSIAEYADHVREVLFGMRFVLDSALDSPGLDLGPPPEPRFTPEPRAVDLERALTGIDGEAAALHDRLAGLDAAGWRCTAIIGGDTVDGRWIARHAVHDAEHHLADVQRLRATLATARP